MQTAAVERVIETSGVMAKAEFGISQVHAAHIMGILRSTLYSRKALAVLREYGSNAWDEHRLSGQPDRPIHVTLPTTFKPTLKIRDFGRGLSEQDVLHVYTQYGESTKRDTNDAAGMLGIGCKSAFCYADQFTVTSWHGGTKCVYVAALDKSNKGEMQKVHDEPCGPETGIEIQVAIRPKDVDEFIREARTLFRYFSPQPVINVISLPALPRGMKSGFILENADQSNRDWIAVMGCIPYRLDLEQLKDTMTAVGLWDALGHLTGGIYLPIGSVEFSASREELQYTETTIAILTKQLQALLNEYVDDSLTTLANSGVTGWERRLKAHFMHEVLKFPLPKEFKPWTDSDVPLWEREKGTVPTSFRLMGHSHTYTTRVNVRQDAHILIQDDVNKSLKGWHFQNSYDVLAVREAGFSYDQVKAEVESFAKALDLEGVPLAPLTTRAYWSTYDSKGKRRYAANQKHKDRTFTLCDSFRDVSPRSAQWQSAQPPDTEHVYVIISEFRPLSITFDVLQKDRNLFREAKIPWPTLYGYKTTSQAPVKPKDIEKGIPYTIWREQALQALITPEIKASIRDITWSEVFLNMTSYRDQKTFQTGLRDLVVKLAYDLGEKHPVTRYFAKCIEAKRELTKLAPGRVDYIQRLVLASGYAPKRKATEEWLQRLMSLYPMLKVVVTADAKMFAFHPTQHYQTLIDYILQQDKLAGGSVETPEA